jgi:hypothetical protein
MTLLRVLTRTSLHKFCRANSSIATPYDALGIPNKPTWSVHELLSSYPSPQLSNTTFKRLHNLSALIPPEEGTAEYDGLKNSLEDLIKLVEAARLVETPENNGEIADGRVWAEGVGLPLHGRPGVADEPYGRDLLKHSSQTTDNGFYVVDVERAE